MEFFAENVCRFNRKVLGIEKREKALLSEEELEITIKCLHEEVNEFLNAQDNKDLIGSVDALIDLMYFSVGALYKMGLTPDEISTCGRIIHQCNMDKQIGINEKRGDGSAADAVKPEDWVGPETSMAEYLGVNR